MARVEAFVTPSVLEWARKSAGLSVDVAAHKIGRPEEDIAAWEAGELRPTLPQARKASEVYRRPLAAFYLPEPPKDFQVLQDYRCLPDDVPSDYSPELSLLVRRCEEHISWAHDYLAEEGQEKLAFVGASSRRDPPEALGRQIRKLVGVSIREQVAARSRNSALNLWIDGTERAGVFVFRDSSVSCEEARGFAMCDDYAPFVFVNSNDSYGAQLFTLSHELAHLLLNESSVSNLLEFPASRRRSQEAQVEQLCNAAAAEAVLPSKVFTEHWREPARGDQGTRIERASNRFKVSREVIARRLLEMRVISATQYRALRRQYNQEWAERRAEQKARFRKSQGGPSPHLMRVVRNGYSFTALVMGAYQGGRLSGRDTSNLLGAKLNHLTKIAAHLHVPTSLFGV